MESLFTGESSPTNAPGGCDRENPRTVSPLHRFPLRPLALALLFRRYPALFHFRSFRIETCRYALRETFNFATKRARTFLGDESHLRKRSEAEAKRDCLRYVPFRWNEKEVRGRAFPTSLDAFHDKSVRKKVVKMLGSIAMRK